MTKNTHINVNTTKLAMKLISLGYLALSSTSCTMAMSDGLGFGDQEYIRITATAEGMDAFGDVLISHTVPQEHYNLRRQQTAVKAMKYTSKYTQRGGQKDGK